MGYGHATVVAVAISCSQAECGQRHGLGSYKNQEGGSESLDPTCPPDSLLVRPYRARQRSMEQDDAGAQFQRQGRISDGTEGRIFVETGGRLFVGTEGEVVSVSSGSAVAEPVFSGSAVAEPVFRRHVQMRIV